MGLPLFLRLRSFQRGGRQCKSNTQFMCVWKSTDIPNLVRTCFPSSPFPRALPMASTIGAWLCGLDGGRFAGHEAAFATHFQTIDDLIEVANAVGVDQILVEVGIIVLTDRVKLKRAIENLVARSAPSTGSAPSELTSDYISRAICDHPSENKESEESGTDWAEEEEDPFDERVQQHIAAAALNASLSATMRHQYEICAVRANSNVGNTDRYLVALVARTPCATWQLSKGLWASIKLQATFVPAAEAAALEAALADTPVARGLGYKPGYTPQQTFLTRVLQFTCARAAPTEAEVQAALEALEWLAHGPMERELEQATGIEDLKTRPLPAIAVNA